MAKSVYPAGTTALAVAADATTPPGRSGDRIWSTVELAELVHDGTAWRRASGVQLAPSGNPGLPTNGAAQAAQGGQASTAARSDHQHPIASIARAGLMSAAQASHLDQAVAKPDLEAAGPSAGTLATGAPQAAQQGTATTAARSDHQHPDATASNAGLMTPSQVTALTAAASAAASKPDLAATGPFAGSAASGAPNASTAGQATTAARSDHWHPIAGSLLPGFVAFGGSGASGSLATGATQSAQIGNSNSAARFDHWHPDATPTNSGLMTAAQAASLAATGALVAAGTAQGLATYGIAQPAQRGQATTAARSDHWHPDASASNAGLMTIAQVAALAAAATLVSAGTAGGAAFGSSTSVQQGIATTAARSDHYHPQASSSAPGFAVLSAAAGTTGTITEGAPQASQLGANTTVSRSDHQHPPATLTNSGLMTPAQVSSLNNAVALVTVGTTAGTLALGAAQNAQAGTAATAARSDHFHPTATPTNAGLMSSAQATALANAAALVASGPTGGTFAQGAPGASFQGQATTAARSDHWHPRADAGQAGLVDLPTGTTVGSLAMGAPQAAQAGGSASAARADHQHPAATTTNAGLMTAAQVTKLNSIVQDANVVSVNNHVDNALVRYNSTNTRWVQSSTAILDDLGNLSGINDITLTGTVDGVDVSTVPGLISAKPSLVAASAVTWGTLDPTMTGLSAEAARADHAHDSSQIQNVQMAESVVPLDQAIDMLRDMAATAQQTADLAPPLITPDGPAGTLASGAPQGAQNGNALESARADHQHPAATASNAGLMSAAQAALLTATSEYAHDQPRGPILHRWAPKFATTTPIDENFAAASLGGTTASAGWNHGALGAQQTFTTAATANTSAGVRHGNGVRRRSDNSQMSNFWFCTRFEPTTNLNGRSIAALLAATSVPATFLTSLPGGTVALVHTPATATTGSAVLRWKSMLAVETVSPSFTMDMNGRVYDVLFEHLQNGGGLRVSYRTLLPNILNPWNVIATIPEASLIAPTNPVYPATFCFTVAATACAMGLGPQTVACGF